MKALVKNLGDQFNVPIDELETLNLEQFVDNAIKVEEGELATLRVSGSNFSSGVIFFRTEQWLKESFRLVRSSSVVTVLVLTSKLSFFPLSS